MSRWGWAEAHRLASREAGPDWLRPLSAAVPWLVLFVAFATVYSLGGVFTSAKGTLFSLPEGGSGDVAETSAVALAMPSEQGTIVFFDDTRYLLDDDSQAEKLGRALGDRAERLERPTLLVVADASVRGGDLVKLAGIARRNRVRRIMFAENRRAAGAAGEKGISPETAGR